MDALMIHCQKGRTALMRVAFGFPNSPGSSLPTAPRASGSRSTAVGKYGRYTGLNTAVPWPGARRPPALSRSREERPRLSQRRAKGDAVRGVRTPRTATHELPFHACVQEKATVAHTAKRGVVAGSVAAGSAGATCFREKFPLS